MKRSLVTLALLGLILSIGCQSESPPAGATMAPDQTSTAMGSPTSPPTGSPASTAIGLRPLPTPTTGPSLTLAPTLAPTPTPVLVFPVPLPTKTIEVFLATPLPSAEATSIAAPVPTPNPSPTPTPNPTPVLAPTPTPVPRYATVWNELENASWLDSNKPELAAKIKSLPWVANGISEGEREEVQYLVRFATLYESVFGALMEKYWVVDGLVPIEVVVLDHLWLVTEKGEGLGLQFIGLEFLDILHVSDISTTMILSNLPNDDRVALLSSILDKPWLADGLGIYDLKVLIALMELEDQSGALIADLLTRERFLDVDIAAVGNTCVDDKSGCAGGRRGENMAQRRL